MADFDGPDFYTVSRSNPTPKYHVIKVPGGTVDYRHFHRSKPIYLVQRLGELCMMNYETNTYSPILGDYAYNDFGDFDYNKENCVVKATITYYQNGYEGYAYFIKYLDASKAEIKYAGKINPNGWRVQSIFMHPSRDLLAIFYVEDYDEDATTITTIDMKTIRH